MNLIKELTALHEAAEHPKLKMPSFGEMQKAIYKLVIPKFLAAQNKKDIADLTAGVLFSESHNDRFWTPAFDDAYSSLERFVEGRNADIDYAIDDISAAIDDVVDRIYNFYTNSMNFEPGTKGLKLKHPGATLVSGDDIADMIYELVPGAKAIEDARAEHEGTITAMHRDFAKIANRQRIGKVGKAALAPFEDAVAKICSDLRKKNAFIVSINADNNSIEFTCRIDTARGQKRPGAAFVEQKDVRVPELFSKLHVDKRDSSVGYEFTFKTPVDRAMLGLIDEMVREYIDTSKDRN